MRPNQLAYWTWCKKKKKKSRVRARLPIISRINTLTFWKLAQPAREPEDTLENSTLDNGWTQFNFCRLSRSFYLIGSNSHSPQNFLLHMVHNLLPKILHLEQKAKKQHVLVWKCTTSWFCWSVCREFSAPSIHPYRHKDDAVLNPWKSFLLPPLFHQSPALKSQKWLSLFHLLWPI